METSAPLINAIVNNALLHTNSCIKQMLPQALKSFTSCAFCDRLAARDFVMKCIEATGVRWPEVLKFYGSLRLLHFPTGGANDAQNVSVDTARGKVNDHQNL